MRKYYAARTGRTGHGSQACRSGHRAATIRNRFPAAGRPTRHPLGMWNPRNRFRVPFAMNPRTAPE
ncbi:MAG: hypothetical protein OJF55_002276 [Rhodanobacteraceae bacterium]|nr:MAG: hypothetical protein OJF55_002276 [Rhodanobacteraceae bacterium]